MTDNEQTKALENTVTDLTIARLVLVIALDVLVTAFAGKMGGFVAASAVLFVSLIAWIVYLTWCIKRMRRGISDE